MPNRISFPRIVPLVVLTLALLIPALLPFPAGAEHTPTHTVSEPTAVAAPDASPAEQGAVSKFFTNIGNGFKAVGRAISDWFNGIVRALGLASQGRPEGSSCEEVTDCGAGLACLNTCFDSGGCEVYEKLCTKIADDSKASIAIKSKFAQCGAGDLCTKGTACTRTCAPGADCEVTNRCLPTGESLGSCAAASDCTAVCGAQPFPAIGPSAFRPICEAGQCRCLTEEVQPELRITACTGDALETELVCPAGMRAACTNEGCDSGNCPVRKTCLTAPAYGGQCLVDAGCADVDCPSDTAPFCDLSDNRCRCKSNEAVTVNCSEVSECQGISCPDDQSRACVGGVCTCEKKVIVEEDFVCTAASQCPANCPEGFSPACVDGSCACQRTQENVPVSCTTVGDCGGVSCPADFEKICLDGTCACTRTTVQ